MGLVSAVFANNNALLDAARKVVQGLARKSPLAVVGTKRVLQHARCVIMMCGGCGLLCRVLCCLGGAVGADD